MLRESSGPNSSHVFNYHQPQMISTNALTISLTSQSQPSFSCPPLSVHPYNSTSVWLLFSLSLHPPLPPALTFNQREGAAVHSTIRQAYTVHPHTKSPSVLVPGVFTETNIHHIKVYLCG